MSRETDMIDAFERIMESYPEHWKYPDQSVKYKHEMQVPDSARATAKEIEEELK